MERTVGQWLEELADSSISMELDDNRMTNLLHRTGFPKAVVVCGIVYLDGKGSIDAPPTDIHSIAKMIVNKVKEVSHEC